MLIGVRLLGREGAEVMRNRKKNARMRTRSILFGEDNTQHLEDIQGPKKQEGVIYSSVKYNIFHRRIIYTFRILLGENS